MLEAQNIKTYTYSDDGGDGEATVYQIFPGITAAFLSVHMDDFDISQVEQARGDNQVTIHYCREGRMEQEVSREFFYLMPGDCSIAMVNQPRKRFQLPLKHYHGITISIDLDSISGPLTDYLNCCGCGIRESLAHICGGRDHIVLRSSETARRFFDGLYEAEEDQRLAFLRVRMPELFYRMKYAQTSRGYYDRNLVPRSQVEIVKAVSGYISENLNGKITLRELTRRFGVSDTYLQNAFRSVYGMPVISFIRVQKMHSAAQVLIHTNRTIEEIAEEFGYGNESKFSAAFRKIMGDTPGTYRKEHTKVNIL